MIVKDPTKLKRIVEDGKTYILNTDTGEKVPDWSDKVRALQAHHRKKKPPLLEAWKEVDFLSLHWAKSHEDLREMAIDRGLIAEDVLVETDELVNLLEKYDHRYDDWSLEKLQASAKFWKMDEDVLDRDNLVRKELVAFLKDVDDPEMLEEFKVRKKARLNKFVFHETKEYKPKWLKEGCVKKPIKYSADDYLSERQCENKVQGKKCKMWDEVSVEVMISKKKYICKECMKNKSPAKKTKNKSPAKKTKK